MSTQWNPVILPQKRVLPQNGGNQILGPFALYTLAAGEVSMIEAVTFEAVGPVVLDFPLQFRIELCDPSGNVLYQKLTPIFNFD